MKKDKKKPYKSVLSNVIWCFREEIKIIPAVFFCTLYLVPVHVGLEYAGVYLPSLVVAEVTSGHSFLHVLPVVGCLMLLIMSGKLFTDFYEIWHTARMQKMKECWQNNVELKALKCFYQTFEQKNVRDLAERAKEACQMWNGVQPLIDVRKHTLHLVENVLCYVLFGTVLSGISPWLVLFLTLAPVVNWISIRKYQNWKYTQREKFTDMTSRQHYIATAAADFSFGKDIRIYGMKDWLIEMHQTLVKEYDGYLKKLAGYEFLSKLAGLFVILLRDGWAYVVLISMSLEGEISVDEFVLYFYAISSFASFIGNIVSEWGSLREVSLKVCDIREFMEYPEPECGTKGTKELRKVPLTICFNHVSFRYDGAKEDTIKDISFQITPGEKIALVGLNGAGKTTIVKLLCGLYYPTDGTITINGIPVTEFKREEYYRLIAPVFQNIQTAFFSLAKTVSGQTKELMDAKRVTECMQRAGLGKKLSGLPEGIHTKLDKQVNADATELSGGEAQKLMLARALYKDAPILVLDEPTAALDPVAENEIYQKYGRMSEGKNSLFISHRLASTRFCDRILYLEQGKIREEGTHEELMKKNGEYRKLFEIQAQWYQKDWNQQEVTP